MAKDTGEEQEKYSPKTGTDVDAGTFTYYDPATNTFKVLPHDPSDPFAHKLGDDYIWGWTPEGDRVVMARPGDDVPTYKAEMGDNNWDTAIGTNPNPVPKQSDNPYYNVSGGMNRDAPPPNPTPPALDTPQDSVGPGYEGDLPPDTNDPFVPPGYSFDPGRPTDNRVNWGGGGSTGVDPVRTNPLEGVGADNPLIGWEASTNKDFYQQQFADMRNRSDNEQLKALAAALRAQEAKDAGPPEATDPWGWAGGSDQFAPQLGTGAPSRVATGEYQLNPFYSWDENTSGSDVLADLSPTFSDAEQGFLNKHPEYINELNLTGGRQGVIDWQQGNPYTNDKGWSAVVSKIANSVYQPTYSNSGPTAPVGYAAPV